MNNTATENTAFRCIVSADLFRRAALCAANGGTRYYLNGVHVEPSPEGGALLVATNGHSLVCIRDPDGVVEGGSGIVRLTRDMMRSIKKPKLPWGDLFPVGSFSLIVANNRAAIAVWRSSDNATPETDAWPLVAQPNGRVAAFQLATTLIDGTFPQWRALIRGRPDPDRAPATLNAHVLAPIINALTPSGINAYQLYRVFASCGELISAPDKDTHFVFASNRDVQGFGLIMPCRSTIDPALPQWIEQPSPADADAMTGGGE